MTFYQLPHMYDFIQEVELDNTIYNFRFTYNERHSFWNISLYEEDMTPIVEMDRAVVNFPLFTNLRDYRLPKGMFALSTGKAEEDLVPESLFNGDIKFFFLPVEEYIKRVEEMYLGGLNGELD